MSVPATRPRRPPPIPPGHSSSNNRLVVSLQAQQLLRSMHIAQSTPNLSRSASEGSSSVPPPPGRTPRRISDSAEPISSTRGLKPSRPPPPSISPPKPYVSNSSPSPVPKTSPKPAPRSRSKTQIATATPQIIVPRPMHTPHTASTDMPPTTSTASPAARTPSPRPAISSPILKSPPVTRVASTTTTTTKPVLLYAPPTRSFPYVKSPIPRLSPKPNIPKKPTPSKPSPTQNLPVKMQTPPIASKSPQPPRRATGPSGNTVTTVTTKPSHSLPRSSPPSRVRSQTTHEVHKSNTLTNFPPPVTKVLVKQKRPPPRPKPPSQAQPRTTQTQPHTAQQSQPQTTQSSRPQFNAQVYDKHIYMAPEKLETCILEEEAGQQEYCTPLGPEDVTTPTTEPPVYSEILDTDYADGYCLIGHSAPNPTYQHSTDISPTAPEEYEAPSSSKIYASLGINRELGKYQYVFNSYEIHYRVIHVFVNRALEHIWCVCEIAH